MLGSPRRSIRPGLLASNAAGAAAAGARRAPESLGDRAQLRPGPASRPYCRIYTGAPVSGISCFLPRNCNAVP